MPTFALLTAEAADLVVRGLIAVHVATALAAMALGAAVFLRRKGDEAHRALGKAYAAAMGMALLSATALLFARFNPFLAGVTALSAHALVTGVRAVALRGRDGRPAVFDRVVLAGGLAAGLGFTLYGVVVGAGALTVSPGSRAPVAILAVLFGWALLQSVREDVRLYRHGPVGTRWWWALHTNRMVGSYIALLTAFSVQAIGPRLPGAWSVAAWIAPGVLGSLVARRALRPARPVGAEERAAAASSAGSGRAIVAP